MDNESVITGDQKTPLLDSSTIDSIKTKMPKADSVELNTSSKLQQYTCLIERDKDGNAIFVSIETGKKFSKSSDFLEFSEKEHLARAYKGKVDYSKLSSFHSILSGTEAEMRLREQESDCCYLTRYSATREELTLSVFRRSGDDYTIFQNFDIVGEPRECPTSYEICGSDQKFNTIDELLDFYKENPITHNIDSIGEEIVSKRAVGEPINSGAEEISTTSNEDAVSLQAMASLYQQRKVLCIEGHQNAVPQWVLKKMKSHPSFHGSMSRNDAVKRLIESERSCYLTRYSAYNKFCAISTLKVLKNGELLQHFELEIPRESERPAYKVAGTTMEFDDLATLLKHYQENPLDENGCLGECLISDKSIELATVYNEDTAAVTTTEDQNKESVDLTRPTRENLRCIHYEDNDGNEQEFRLMEQVSDRWFKAGICLRLNKTTLDKCRDKAKDDSKRCDYVFSKWIKTDGREGYPLTWRGLHSLLIDIGRRSAAEKLSKVLKSNESERSKDTMFREIL